MLRAAFIILVLYVILSVSEISHRAIALLVVIARHEVPRQSP